MNTKTKRFSMTQLGEGDHLLPVPDATIHKRDRLLLLGLYSGILDVEASGNIFWWYIMVG